MKIKIVPIHPSHGEALEAFIAEALDYIDEQWKDIIDSLKAKEGSKE